MPTIDVSTTPGRLRRSAAATIVGAIALTACGGGDDPAAGDTSTAAAPTGDVTSTNIDVTAAAPPTVGSTMPAPTTVASTTAAPTTAAPTTAAPTTAAPTTAAKETAAATGPLKVPFAWSEATAGVVGPTKNLNRALKPVAEVPEKIPTPAKLELVEANYQIYRDRHDIVLTATTEVGLDDLITFFETKYAAQQMPQSDRIDQEGNDGTRSVVLEFDAEGEQRNNAEVTISEADDFQVVQYRLWINGDGTKEVQQQFKWAQGFPGTDGLDPWFASAWVSPYGTVVVSYGWDAPDELDKKARMKAVRTGLPWNGIGVDGSDDPADDNLYLANDVFPGSNSRVEVITSSVTLSLAIEE